MKPTNDYNTAQSPRKNETEADAARRALKEDTQRILQGERLVPRGGQINLSGVKHGQITVHRHRPCLPLMN